MSNLNALKNVVNSVSSFREQLYNEGLTAAQKTTLPSFLETLPKGTPARGYPATSKKA